MELPTLDSAIQLDKQSIFNDCFLIALQNYTGKTRAEIVTACNKAGLEEWMINLSGTPHHKIPEIIKHLTGQDITYSRARRGQYKLSGICYWKCTAERRAHATAILNGVVLNTDGTYCTTKQYRQNRPGWVLSGVWCFDINLRG